ncbi:hypothetical protein LCGC14_1275010 [marine sediment metagenome]|uniref:Uncharacterized protein n=1 Tax=marine sediment metagenome TaxID=412755 RepID=A0A0F9NDN2_9ZZZZ
MKKPEIKYWTGECGGLEKSSVTRNKAIEEYEEYHNYVLSKLPTEEDLMCIITNSEMYDTIQNRETLTVGSSVGMINLAKAIYKRQQSIKEE